MNFDEFIIRLTPHAFDIIRLILIILAVALRFALMPIYLQAYLNIAHDRLEEQKKEAGRITNVDLQRKVRVSCKKKMSHNELTMVHFFLISGGLNILLFVCRHITVCGATDNVLIFCAHV